MAALRDWFEDVSVPVIGVRAAGPNNRVHRRTSLRSHGQT